MAVLLLDDSGKLLLLGVVDLNADLPGLLLQTDAKGGPWLDDPFEHPHYVWKETDRIDVRHSRK